MGKFFTNATPKYSYYSARRPWENDPRRRFTSAVWNIP